MNINKNCDLFLRNVYSYDISSCHFNILKNIGHSIVDEIKDYPKDKKNIQIGLLMRDDPKLIKILNSSTNGTISEYLSLNNIKDDDIITRQYDGFLTLKKLKNIELDLSLKLELRNIFKIFIISLKRDSYIATDYTNYSFKGISEKYEEIENYYRKILSVNFLCKMSIFKMLESIKNDILYGENVLLYFIPSKYDNNFGTIFLKNYGETQISKAIINMIDINDIDKEKYYDKYFKLFFQSILIEFL